MGTIRTQETIVSLNRWYEFVNIVDPSRAKFGGWISVPGLPFNFQNQDKFEYIGSMCGDLIEIHEQTKNFSALSEARIRV